MLDSARLLHCKGFVHRDIKPANYCLASNGQSRQIYLVDFGFVKPLPQKVPPLPVRWLSLPRNGVLLESILHTSKWSFVNENVLQNIENLVSWLNDQRHDALCAVLKFAGSWQTDLSCQANDVQGKLPVTCCTLLICKKLWSSWTGDLGRGAILWYTWLC